MIQYEITKETVVCADGLFQEHPESYKPRIFIRIAPNEDKQGCSSLDVKYYEMLRTGEALIWPSFPGAGKFDYLQFNLRGLKDVMYVCD